MTAILYSHHYNRAATVIYKNSPGVNPK